MLSFDEKKIREVLLRTSVEAPSEQVAELEGVIAMIRSSTEGRQGLARRLLTEGAVLAEPTEIDYNRLSQFFYERASVAIRSQTYKPVITEALRDTFEAWAKGTY